LEDQTRNRKTTAVKFVHGRALLLCDAGPHGDPWKVADVAAALGITPRTVEHLKQRFVEEGIERPWNGGPERHRPKSLLAVNLTHGLRPWRVPRPPMDERAGRCACWRRSLSS
jgi:hypothetical protein